MKAIVILLLLFTSAAPANAALATLASDRAASQPQAAQDQAARPKVYRARVVPHWFANNTRFWYRNDLPGDAREFIVVDAENGTRARAFDHAAVAQQIGGVPDPLHLPIEQLLFAPDNRIIALLGQEKCWELDLPSGKLQETSRPPTNAENQGLPSENAPRPSLKNGPESEITFDNRLNQPVALFWLDDQAQRRSYGKIEPGRRKIQHTFAGHVWLVADAQGRTLAVFEATRNPNTAVITNNTPVTVPEKPPTRQRERPERRGESVPSLDGRWNAVLRKHNVFIRNQNGQEFQLSRDGVEENGYRSLTWSPDSKTLLAWRTQPGERKEVHLLRSSPRGGGRARLESRPYALPGDKFNRYELNLFEVANHTQIKPAVDPFEHEWLPPRCHWRHDGTEFTYLQVDRGHQRLRVIAVDRATGMTRNIIDERSATFLWTVHTETLRLELVNWLESTDEIIYVSERDGWRHLYLVDIQSASIRQITNGPWVLRGIERIDEKSRQIWFTAGGRNPGQDPYFLQYYRVNFDGSGLVALTDGNGNHQVDFSPDRNYLIDTWSRVDLPPVNELRRVSDGTLVCKLEEAVLQDAEASHWTAPEPFVAKARDGQTDIWGVIYRPQPLDLAKKYPVVEYIYAGPQGSYVPKSFSAENRFASLTRLGFAVVQIDGMGTANRSKAFHDVCYRNLKDAGFPDRILWMKAAAAKFPWLDLSRVGVFGNSAGGQNAAAALLFHPEFYKAAVASCGCHDNRMDKASWNEQWMGYVPPDKLWEPGPANWYAQSSNIENAHLLQGRLFLIVGEMDNNVPPESTLRFADALIRAGKDFDLLVIPNGGHGMGGEYGERRMRDFFSRHLLGIEPPNRNAAPSNEETGSDPQPPKTAALYSNSVPQQQVTNHPATPLQPVHLQADDFPLRSVRLLDGPFRSALDINKAFLRRLDPDRLLAGFRREAALSKKAEPYGGWETIPEKGRYSLAGQGLGHYLSALSLMAGSTGDPECRRRAEYIVDELNSCQKAAGTGILCAFPESKQLFAELAAGEIKSDHLFGLNGGYVPLYVTHKVMAGLRDAWFILGNETARDVLVRMADWLNTVFESLTDAQIRELLETEHGGIMEVVADVYGITGENKYMTLAQRLNHTSLFTPLSKGEDSLTGLHANAQIPKVIGMERIYELTGDATYAKAARFFWDTVVKKRSFVIGGHGENEFFFDPSAFATTGLLSATGPETCNSYNMIKLSRRQWLAQPTGALADYIERTLFNHILPSQEPERGGFVYFTSMRPGQYRTYSSDTDDFWCCTDTGMESHAKHGQFIFARSADRLWVNFLVASELDWAEKGLHLRLETRFPETGRATLALTTESPRAFEIAIRNPGWLAPGQMRLSVNGSSQGHDSPPGSYAILNRTWRTGDRIEIEWPLSIQTELLPGSEQWVSVLWGPIVLAGQLGREGLEGVDLSATHNYVATKKLPIASIPVFVGTRSDVQAKIAPVPGAPLLFRTAGLARPNDVSLAPFYQVHNERYAIYWKLEAPGSRVLGEK